MENIMTERLDEYVPLRLTASQREALDRLALHDRRSISEYIRILIDDHIRSTRTLDIVLQRVTIEKSEAN
jgi:hypothetical protein